MDSARRWSGYVCPDCRFVFRVPRDHDGKGIVCLSCRRILKIPALEDITLPLMSSVSEQFADRSESDRDSQKIRKRRKGNTKLHKQNLSWEEEPSYSRASTQDDRYQTRLVMTGVVSLFIIAACGVILLKGGNKSKTIPLMGTVLGSVKVLKTERSDASYLAEMEPLATQFLCAKSVSEILPLVRDPKTAEPRMMAFYAQGKIEPLGMSKFNPNNNLVSKGKLKSLSIITGEQVEKIIVFIDTPEGLKVDWESFVGWSATHWPDFLNSKTSTAQVFRVTLSTVDYYNFSFTDDSKWQSYHLASSDGEHSVYGYVEKNSLIDKRIKPNGEIRKVQLILSLKFPEGMKSDNQVLIDRCIAEGWVEE